MMDEREQQIASVYKDIADRNTAAYDAARRIYEAQHPFPMERKIKRTDFLIVVAVFIIVTASIIVSGSRTIVEFGGGIVGVSAFVMIEMAVVLYSFYQTRINWNKAKLEDTKKLVKWGLGITVAIAITANVHATLGQNGVYIIPFLKTVILVIIAVSAPGLAWISGDILGIEYMRYLSNAEEVEAENSKAKQDWWTGLNDKFQADERKWGTSIKVETEKVILPQFSNGNSNASNGNLIPSTIPSETTLGHTKAPDATQVAIAYFQEDPSRLQEKPALAVAALKGRAGKSTVYKVWGEMQK
jgi:hypothetical protein